MLCTKQCIAYLTPRRRERCPSKLPRYNSLFDSILHAVYDSRFECWVWAK